MKNRLSIVAMVSLVVLAGLVWFVARSQRANIHETATRISIPANQPAIQPVQAQDRILPAPISAPVVSPVVQEQPAVAVEQPAAPQTPAAVAEPTKELKYTARSGDSVSSMAGAFLGNSDASHQDTIINANKSLRADPDRVVVGKSYRIPAPDGLSAAAVAPQEATARPMSQPDADQVVVDGSPRTLRYTAQAGDTVTTLAVQLLGSDTQEARDAIINNNPSLKKNPDRVIAGQAYWIPAPVASIQSP